MASRERRSRCQAGEGRTCPPGARQPARGGEAEPAAAGPCLPGSAAGGRALPPPPRGEDRRLPRGGQLLPAGSSSRRAGAGRGAASRPRGPAGRPLAAGRVTRASRAWASGGGRKRRPRRAGRRERLWARPRPSIRATSPNGPSLPPPPPPLGRIVPRPPCM